MAKDTVRRSRLAESWVPSAADREFAAKLGVDADRQADFFRDYHIARGNLMASWPAAWRTWCRKEVESGRAPGRPAVDTSDPADSYGAEAWARQLTDAKQERVTGGVMALCVNGWDVVMAARNLCEAVGLPASWRGDLSPIAEWLRAGIEPDAMLAVVRRGKGPRKPGTWRYYHAAMMEQPREDA